MNILNEHFGKYAMESKTSCLGNQCLFKQFESALNNEKSVLNWIAENQIHLNDHFGKKQMTILQK